MSVVSRDTLSGFQRWEPPQVGDGVPSPTQRESAPRPTVSDLQALERQAHEEGYAAGRAEGLATAQQESKARMAKLDALYDSAARPLQAMDEATEQELARLALVVARQVIAHELATTPELVIHAVRQAVAALPSATRELRVLLHPADLALMREMEATETHWQLVADATLSRGGCRLESGGSRLDARLETRLAGLVDAVLGDDLDDVDGQVSP